VTSNNSTTVSTIIMILEKQDTN